MGWAVSPFQAAETRRAALRTRIAEEVIPFHIAPEDLPGHMRDAAGPGTTAPAVALLSDAMGRMARASAQLEKNAAQQALAYENESLELMAQALDLMVHILQRLLGQLSPPALAPGSGASRGMALDPAGGGLRAASWLFALPSEQREIPRQAFRVTFPRRYDRAIKLYYERIAREKSPE